MGKVKGIFVGDISGSVGKVTFRKRSQENIVSQKVSEVSNPRTYAQQVQRMKMNTVVSAYSALKEICNHSFENCIGERENMSMFIKRNLAWLVVSPNDESLLNNYSFIGKKKEGVKFVPNDYIISEGSLKTSFEIRFDSELYGMRVLSKKKDKSAVEFTENITVEEFLKILNCDETTQITVVNANHLDMQMYVSRYIFDETSLTEKAFVKKGNYYVINENNLKNTSKLSERSQLALFTKNNKFYLYVGGRADEDSGGIILSRKENGKWKYSTSKLCFVPMPTDGDWAAKYQIESYKPSTNSFLNNADL